MKNRRIMSVAELPPGWRAVYRLDGRTVTRSITAVALVESHGDELPVSRQLVGIVPDGSHSHLADCIPGAGHFLGYSGPGEDPERALGLRELLEAGSGAASPWFG